MSDRQQLTDLLTQFSPQYTSCQAKLAVERSGEKERLVQGVLLFGRAGSIGTIDRDYGSVILLERTLSLADGRAALDDIFQAETSIRLRHQGDLMINRHPSQWAPGPAELPIPFGAHRRFSGWPERHFLMRAENGGQLPRGPLVRRGLPTILSTDSVIHRWLGLDSANLALNSQNLRVVLPDFRARIKMVQLRRQSVSVEYEAAEPGTVDIVANMEDADHVIEKPLELTHFTGHVQLPRFPEKLFIFLRDGASGEVFDWCEIDPYASKQPDGVTAELPPSVLEDALSKGEGEEIEFKKSLSSQNRDDVVATVVAFSNAKGGRIFLGVDNIGAVVGVDETDRIAQRMRDYCHDRIDPSVSVGTAPIRYDDRDVVAVTVPAGAHPPYQHRASGKYLIRKGETDRPMTRTDMDAAYDRERRATA